MIAFYLGTHRPHWLGLVDFPLMVSHRTLAARATLPRARGPWMLDSGAFTELRDFGHFRTSPRVYVAAVRRYFEEVGPADQAAIQDWMCEPIVIVGGVAGGQRFAGTGLSVAEHQRRTVRSFLELRDLAPDLPWLPTVQGHSLADYGRCVELYDRAGVDLTAAPLVGLGGVCRRQATSEIAAIVATLADARLRLHGFGVKTLGLGRYVHDLCSADSLAWSYDAHRTVHEAPRSLDHRHPRGGKTCANCLTYATRWRARLLAGLPAHQQLRFAVGGAA